MASLQHRGSSKSPVNEINLSQPICRVGVTLVGPKAVYASYTMRATDNIFGAPRSHRGPVDHVTL